MQDIITASTNSAERLDCNGLENLVLRKCREVAILAVLSFGCNCRSVTGGQACLLMARLCVQVMSHATT